MEEQNGTVEIKSDEKHLKRGLTNRHIQLMAMGGAIGTGLFMGSGKTISLAGPSILLVYLIIGVALFFVMRAMGELLLSNLAYKSFRDMNADILGPSAGYFTGWTYWFCWVVTGIADIVAISDYAHFWFPNCPGWIPALLVVILMLVLNLLAVKMFGETVFWFSIIKIIAIVLLIVVGIVMVAVSFQSPDGVKASVSNIWNYDGFFATGFHGFLAGFQIAVFAFVGIELAGTAAAETKDPLVVLPKAINAIPIFIILFYICTLAVIMMVRPWNTLDADHSPFVELFAYSGLGAAASIVNFVVLTSAASSANNGLYSTSRMLYGLALEKAAPKLFSYLSKKGIPANGLLFSCVCLLGGAIVLLSNNSAMGAFTIVTTISSILFMFVWGMILVSYLRYRRIYPEKHEQSVFKMPLAIFMCWVVLAFFVFVLYVLGLEDDTRQALMCAPIWFIIVGITWYFVRHNHKKWTPDE